MMKRLRLSDILKSKAFQVTGQDFRKSAVPNPFDDDDDMAAFVRDRGAKQGLDRVSRSHTGPDSGVNASRYDDMVRDIDDLGLEPKKDPSIRRTAVDHALGNGQLDADEDNLYLTGIDKSYSRNEFNQPEDIDDFDADAGWAFMKDLSEIDDEMDDEEFEDEIEDEGNFEETRYDGVVRSVKGAYLVSKDQQPDGTFKEVWVYNVGDKFDDEANIRKGILAATDIDPTKNFSEDGSQEAHLDTVGNVQFLTITGLPD